MRMFTEEELQFDKVDGIGSIAMVKRVRTLEPYDAWYVVDKIETCDGYRKRTTRTYTKLEEANKDYHNKHALMKAKRVSKWLSR